MDAAAPGFEGRRWRFVADTVMGGRSRGRLAREAVAGREAWLLEGEVSLENHGGFMQMALDAPELPPPPAGAHGIVLEVCGDGRAYGLHLRTADLGAPWQAWRARFAAPDAWTEVALPWSAFVAHGFAGERIDPTRVVRLGVVAIGEAGPVRLALGRIGWR